MTRNEPPGALTSKNNPIRVACIESADVPAAARWTGRQGMTFLPGKRDHGIAGHHWRDLNLDVERLREHHHVDAFVLLVEDHEHRATSTTGIAAMMREHGVELVRYPIVDGGIPADLAALRVLLDETAQRLRAGQRVVVACRGGLGRTGTVVACLLCEAGLSAADAIKLTRSARSGTIENARQEAFVRAWS